MLRREPYSTDHLETLAKDAAAWAVDWSARHQAIRHRSDAAIEDLIGWCLVQVEQAAFLREVAERSRSTIARTRLLIERADQLIK